MVNALSLKICGSNSFPREEDEDYNYERAVRSAGSSPRRPSKGSKNHNKNLYSNRGLDKFSALLAEIEEKTQKIYSEISPEKISFVQFDYSKDNNCKPIVVKAKAHNDQAQIKKRRHTSGPLDTRAQPMADQDQTQTPTPLERSPRQVGPTNAIIAREKRFLRGVTSNMEMLRRPKYYLPMVLILILVFLALFGRSVAIMCTSIGWYLIPTIANGDSKNRRKSFKRKVLVGHQGGITSFKHHSPA